MTGRALGVATSTSVGEAVTVPYIATSVTQAIYIAPQQCIVTQISYRIRVASTSGVAVFYKTPSGTAAASGTALTGNIDLGATPTADTTISVPLIQGPGLSLNAGDSISVLLSGTMTNGIGLMQVFVEPAA